MKIRVNSTRQLLTVLGGLLYLLIIVFQPLPTDASTLIYTIQVGSFKNVERATRQYDSVIDRLNKEALDNLRIEKIGQNYSVRLGNFVDPINGNNLHRTIKHIFPSTLLMKAYIKDERIIKMYSNTGSLNKKKKNDSLSVSRNSEFLNSLVSDEKKEEDRLYYTIQIGSFIPHDRARNEFASAIQKLFDQNPDHLRIEKVGIYNSVRIGKFADYIGAEKYLASVKAHFSAAFIIQAYVKDKRIVSELKRDHSHEESRTNIETNSLNSNTPVTSLDKPGFTGNDQLEQYSKLPAIDKCTLHGTVIMNNVRLAIIEDSDSKQSYLYKLNDQIGGFIVSDILENTVILKDKDTMVKILLWENNKNVLSNPDPELSQDIEEESSQGKSRMVMGVEKERGRRLSGKRLLERQRLLNESLGRSIPNP
ncbi:MAG: hypothetical protein AMK70_16055 [Nitrospira bacterium SG8_35_1]|nr:MAG: hypothetical protein AMK70_16055 [Nitrospira bacterium SG8_35_1]